MPDSTGRLSSFETKRDSKNLQHNYLAHLCFPGSYNLSTIRILAFRVISKVRFSLGGSGDSVLEDAAGNFADNAGQILTNAGTARHIRVVGRFTF